MKPSEVALLVLIALVAFGAAGGTETPSRQRAPRGGSKPPEGKRWKRRMPFGPQPEPTDAQLLTPPWDMSYPLYADLLWIEYAKDPERPGPALVADDLDRKTSGAALLTPFEQWALRQFCTEAELTALPDMKVEAAQGMQRFHRYSLSVIAALLTNDRVSMLEAGRALYNQARDFYRGAR